MGMLAQERRQFTEAEKLFLKAKAIFKKYHDGYSMDIVHSSLEKLNKIHTKKLNSIYKGEQK